MSETPSLPEKRAALLASGLPPADVRRELTGLYTRWLSSLLPTTSGIALAAVGGMGRGETLPYGDLDLVLLHDPRVDVSALAQEVWYPVWDARLSLDHSVRTPSEALLVAREDLKAALGLLDLRHVAGDETLTHSLHASVLTQWRATAPARMQELHALARERWERCGEASFLLEPHLKDARGGVRDWVNLRALAAAQLVDLLPDLRSAATTLLDVRTRLHLLQGRSEDTLRTQDRFTLASISGVEPDALLRSVNEAARTISYATDEAWRRVTSKPSLLSRRKPPRAPLAQDVVVQDGEVVLARSANPQEPALLLRLAQAAARADLPISPHTLTRLSRELSSSLPWSAEMRDDFVGLLGEGRRMVAVLEALDRHALLSRLIPGWEDVRILAQHNPVHRFTVDRHLVETVVHATTLASQVRRPDLLLVGALLHDIGKGHPGDHSVVGAHLAAQAASHMGFPPEDVDILAALARHHLLLPDTATRRDPEDPATLRIVTDAVLGSKDLLSLLHALTIADAAATGPLAWTRWKEALVADLVARSEATLAGLPLPLSPSSEEDLLLAQGGTRILVDDLTVTVVAPDSPGLLSKTAGLLALHSLDVRTAEVHTVGDTAVNRFCVEPRFNRLPDAPRLTTDLHRILEGNLDLPSRLVEKERTYHESPTPERTRLLWFDEESTADTILEVRTEDTSGLLFRLTAALERAGVDIRSARISSLGAYVVDAFYLTVSGLPLSPTQRAEVESLVMASLG